MSDDSKQPTPQEMYQAWQKYFEEQQKVVLNYWTAVFNSMWGQGK